MVDKKTDAADISANEETNTKEILKFKISKEISKKGERIVRISVSSNKDDFPNLYFVENGDYDFIIETFNFGCYEDTYSTGRFLVSDENEIHDIIKKIVGARVSLREYIKGWKGDWEEVYTIN